MSGYIHPYGETDEENDPIARRWQESNERGEDTAEGRARKGAGSRLQTRDGRGGLVRCGNPSRGEASGLNRPRITQEMKKMIRKRPSAGHLVGWNPAKVNRFDRQLLVLGRRLGGRGGAHATPRAASSIRFYSRDTLRGRRLREKAGTPPRAYINSSMDFLDTLSTFWEPSLLDPPLSPGSQPVDTPQIQ